MDRFIRRNDGRNPRQGPPFGWRNSTGVRLQELFRACPGPPDIRTNIDTHADASRTRSDNAELRRPLNYFIAILQNRDFRDYFIRILQDRNCRNLLLARSQSVWPEFNEIMERAFNDYRLRDHFINVIQNQEQRDRFINMLQNPEQRNRFIYFLRSYLRQGERTPSFASDGGTEDASSTYSAFGTNVARSGPDWFTGDDEISDGSESPSGDGIRPFGP